MSATKFYIEYRGLTLPEEFASRAAAEKWALWNYKGSRVGWIIKDKEARVMTKPNKVRERYNPEAVKAQRRILNRAYLAIRDDPTKMELVNSLARALGGSAPVTGELMAQAIAINNAGNDGQTQDSK